MKERIPDVLIALRSLRDRDILTEQQTVDIIEALRFVSYHLCSTCRIKLDCEHGTRFIGRVHTLLLPTNPDSTTLHCNENPHA